MSVSGLLVIDKPAGMTSHDVVAKLRKILKTRRVGHAGTLDPMATGLLIIGVESGTKALQFISSASKTYEATICLGVTTDTDDADGQVVATAGVSQITDERIRSALAAMVGEIAQVPSSVSAIKVAGKRAYDLARAGEAVELKPRLITISSLDIHHIERRGECIFVSIVVSCSSGTYIRAIARDLGVALQVGGHLTALRRTLSSGFTVADAHSLDELGLEPIPLRQALKRFLTEVVVTADEVPKVLNGLNLEWRWPKSSAAVMVIAQDTDALLAIGQESAGRLTYHSVFNQALAD